MTAKWNETMEKYQFYKCYVTYIFDWDFWYLQVVYGFFFRSFMVEQFFVTRTAHRIYVDLYFSSFSVLNSLKSQIPRTKPQNTFINSFQKDTYRLRIFFFFCFSKDEKKKRWWRCWWWWEVRRRSITKKLIIQWF